VGNPGESFGSTGRGRGDVARFAGSGVRRDCSAARAGGDVAVGLWGALGGCGGAGCRSSRATHRTGVGVAGSGGRHVRSGARNGGGMEAQKNR